MHDDLLKRNVGLGSDVLGAVDLSAVSNSQYRPRLGNDSNSHVPKCSLAQLALDFIIGDLRATKEARLRSLVRYGKRPR
jgi:hypothetical protein